MDNKTAKRIVKEIIDDLSDRRGLRQEWEQIDDDTQHEIRDTWVKIVLKADSPLFHLKGRSMNAAKRYESIPVVVDAIQWTGDNIEAAEKFCPHLVTRRTAPDLLKHAEIRQHGMISVRPGDWIVLQGRLYMAMIDESFQQQFRDKESTKLGY